MNSDVRDILELENVPKKDAQEKPKVKYLFVFFNFKFLNNFIQYLNFKEKNEKIDRANEKAEWC